MYIAIDIGGTKIEVAFYASGQLDSRLDSFAIPTPQKYDEGLRQLLTGITHHQEDARFDGVGVSFPGIVDKEGNILQASNIPDWYSKPLKDDLAKSLKTGVLMVQDASCSAIAEYVYGGHQELPQGRSSYHGHRNRWFNH